MNANSQTWNPSRNRAPVAIAAALVSTLVLSSVIALFAIDSPVDAGTTIAVAQHRDRGAMKQPVGARLAYSATTLNKL